MKKLFTLLALVASSTLYSQSIIRGPYLQSPNWNSIKVMWRSDSATSSNVKYGLSPADLSSSASVPGTATNHIVTISGLQPSTTYFYAIADSAGAIVEGGDSLHRFKTWPTPGTVEPIRVWGIGDFGKGNDKQGKCHRAYMKYPGAAETDLWIWMGDNAYDDGTDEEFQNKVFDPVNGYDSIFNFLPFMPSPGNHDYNSVSPVTNAQPPLEHSGPYFDLAEVPRNGESGGVASGHELYYSYDYGNAHFLSLNSEIGSLFVPSDDWIGVNLLSGFSSSPFTQWLHADLQANTKPWVIAYFHQPPYTAGSHDADAFWEVYMKAMRENITPILEQYGVDLIVCGHSHVYERSYLLQGFYSDLPSFNPETMVLDAGSGREDQDQAYHKHTLGSNANRGTVYVVCGNSGSSDDSAPLNHPAMYVGYGCDTCVGSFVMDINDNRLDGRHLNAYGEIIDHFTIFKDADSTSNTSIHKLPVSAGPISEVSIFPNPFSRNAEMKFTLAERQQIRIELCGMDEKNKLLLQAELNPGEHSIGLNASELGLTPGVYGIMISSPTHMLSRKVVHVK
ncbi:MAG: metallophosphoesterase family protein [Bacteroidia bacterium]|nr:metallophosphoesterase family protein [Bacteroidia bacterium]